MSVASWYYCNLLDDVSAVVPVVQERRNAGEEDAKVAKLRPAMDLTLGAQVDEELAVGRAMYALATVTSDSEETVCEQVATEPVVVESVEVEAEKEDTVEEVTKVELGEGLEKASEEESAECLTVEDEAIDEAAAEVVQQLIEEALNVDEEMRDAAEAEEDVVVDAAIKEVVNVVETVHDGIETIVVEEDIDEPAVIQAVVEEEKPVEVELVADEPVAEPAVSQEVNAEAVVLDSDPESMKQGTHMASIPEDELPVKEVGTEELATGEQVLEPAEPVTDEESESEISIMKVVELAPVANVVEEPESEIDETMFIDPDVAKETEAPTSVFSIIPEQLRKNSYAVSSVAVAVTTAIVATLVARR